MFWMTVGQARRQTADAIGPSTSERSNFRDAEEVADGWMTDSIAFPRSRAASNARKPATDSPASVCAESTVTRKTYRRPSDRPCRSPA